MITKGALSNVLDACSTARDGEGKDRPIAQVRGDIERLFAQYSANGQRTLGLATKNVGATAKSRRFHTSAPARLGIAPYVERCRSSRCDWNA